jgi:hypothetical protein
MGCESVLPDVDSGLREQASTHLALWPLGRKFIRSVPKGVIWIIFETETAYWDPFGVLL